MENEEIKIELYTKEKIPDVLAFERQLRAEEDVWGWEIDDAYLKSVTDSFEDSRFKNAISLLAYMDGQVVGRSVKAYLDWICVLKSARHKGVAQALMNEMRSRLKAEGIDTLIALTASNDEAQSFYRSVPDSSMHDIGIWIDIK